MNKRNKIKNLKEKKETTKNKIDELDEKILDDVHPSIFEYLFYIFNFVGNFYFPVYSYIEYKHFIQKTFKEKKI